MVEPCFCRLRADETFETYCKRNYGASVFFVLLFLVFRPTPLRVVLPKSFAKSEAGNESRLHRQWRLYINECPEIGSWNGSLLASNRNYKPIGGEHTQIISCLIVVDIVLHRVEINSWAVIHRCYKFQTFWRHHWRPSSVYKTIHTTDTMFDSNRSTVDIGEAVLYCAVSASIPEVVPKRLKLITRPNSPELTPSFLSITRLPKPVITSVFGKKYGWTCL